MFTGGSLLSQSTVLNNRNMTSEQITLSVVVTHHMFEFYYKELHGKICFKRV